MNKSYINSILTENQRLLESSTAILRNLHKLLLSKKKKNIETIKEINMRRLRAVNFRSYPLPYVVTTPFILRGNDNSSQINEYTIYIIKSINF
jgi:hypothetical protein